MYRPNRIGPSMLVHIDEAIKAYGTLATAHKVAENVINMIIPDATLRARTASRTFKGFASLTTSQFISFGVAVNGQNPAGELAGDGSTGFLVTVAGSVTLRHGTHAAAEASLVPFAIIARADAAALETFATEPSNLCTGWAAIPCQISNGAEFTHMSFKETLIMGNFDGADTYVGNPLIGGFAINNTSAETQDAEIRASLSIHKYVTDIDTYDPSRS